MTCCDRDRNSGTFCATCGRERWYVATCGHVVFYDDVFCKCCGERITGRKGTA